jgi:mycofactocin system glycosyltransferase
MCAHERIVLLKEDSMHALTERESAEDNVRQPVAYRFRSGVSYWCRSDSKPLLVLDFPLRALAVQHCWRPLLQRMASGDFVSVEALASSLPDMPLDKTEIFLEHLVRRAFCDPSVSIVVPVRNRPEDLALCLDSLTNLKYPAEKTEIIVVDDASSDDTVKVAERFSVTIISLKTRKQASYCRNLGAQQARGEILAFVDSDCAADPLWLHELIPVFKDPDVGAVGGMVDSYFEDKGLDRYEKVKSSLQVSAWFKRSSEEERFFYVPSCNLLIRRSLFLDLGGFREDLHVGEDVDLCWRLQNHGEVLEYRPVGRVYHKHRNRLLPFCRRRFQYGTSEPTLQQLHPERVKQLLLPVPEFLFWVLVTASACLACVPLLFVAAATLLLHACFRYSWARRRNIPLQGAAIAGAVLRSSLSLCYHVCSFVSRYYLALFAALWPLVPWLSAAVLCMHVMSGMVQYATKHPQLNPFSFLAFFSLEQISYQLGVWWGCLRRAYFRPVIPRLVLKGPWRS